MRRSTGSFSKIKSMPLICSWRISSGRFSSTLWLIKQVDKLRPRSTTSHYLLSSALARAMEGPLWATEAALSRVALKATTINITSTARMVAKILIASKLKYRARSFRRWPHLEKWALTISGRALTIKSKTPIRHTISQEHLISRMSMLAWKQTYCNNNSCNSTIIVLMIHLLVNNLQTTKERIKNNRKERKTRKRVKVQISSRKSTTEWFAYESNLKPCLRP